jgi:hypothetical protein
MESDRELCPRRKHMGTGIFIVTGLGFAVKQFFGKFWTQINTDLHGFIVFG